MEIKMQHKVDLEASSVEWILSNFWVAKRESQNIDKEKTGTRQEAALYIILYSIELQILHKIHSKVDTHSVFMT